MTRQEFIDFLRRELEEIKIMQTRLAVYSALCKPGDDYMDTQSLAALTSQIALQELSHRRIMAAYARYRQHLGQPALH
jgi:hypothetical protein